MANPQRTDAHLRIAHSITEAIMMRDFKKRHRKILDLILRLSWGCNKKFAIIPRQRDFSTVGVNEVDIKEALDWLEASKIIFRDGPNYSFNKNFEEWQVSRISPFQPEKLSNLLSINLNGHKELSKTLSENLVKHEVGTSQNTKFATPNLASPKESIKESIKEKNVSISNKYNKLTSRNNDDGKDFTKGNYGTAVCTTRADIEARKKEREKRNSIGKEEEVNAK